MEKNNKKRGERVGICKGTYRIRNFDAADGIDFCCGHTVFKY